jgi:hypothetical protein
LLNAGRTQTLCTEKVRNTRQKKVANEVARKRVAEEVNWGEYFASIVSVCPWSRAYWLQQQIDIQTWTGDVQPLGDNAARVYTHRMNDQRDREEWLWSHPRYGGHSAPMGCLIQQDHDKLQHIRSQQRAKTEPTV